MIERLKLSACSFLSLLLRLKEKETELKKEKNAKIQYRLRRHKTANAVICVFACRQKSLSTAKTTPHACKFPSTIGKGDIGEGIIKGAVILGA